MAKSNHIVNSFVAGEISPKAFGRTDTNQYNSACEDTFNSLIYPQGGFGKRPGTQYIYNNVNSIGTESVFDPVLIPFTASNGKSFVLVLSGPGNPSNVSSVRNWYAINTETKAVTYMFSDFEDLFAPPDLQYAQAGDVVMCAHKDYRPFRVSYNAVTGVFSALSYPRYTQAQIANEFWRQMPFLPPVIGKNIVNVANTAALTLTYNAQLSINITVPSGSQVVFTPDMVNNFIKFTNGTNSLVVKITQYNNATSVKAAKIGGNYEPTTGTTTTYADTNTDNFYEEGYWDEKKGWPRTVTFFETRLVFGGSKTFPDMMWFSRTENIERMDQRGLVSDTDFATPVATTIPFSVTLRSNVLNQINWMSTGKNITTGTNFREFVVRGPSESKSIGSDNIQTQAETAHGSAYSMAVRIDNSAVFLHRSRAQVRELSYNLSEDSFQAANLNILSEHVATKSAFKGYQVPEVEKYLTYSNLNAGVTSRIRRLALQESPSGILWALDTNGALWGLTRERQQQVSAWHYHELAGTGKILLNGTLYPMKPIVMAIACVQQPEGIGPKGVPDDLWMVVRRQIPRIVSGNTVWETKTYIECMAQEFDQRSIFFPGGSEDLEVRTNEPNYMDCTFRQNGQVAALGGNAIGVFGPLPQGPGETVSVVVDGVYYGDFVVDTNRKVTIPQITNRKCAVTIGYRYSNYIVPVVPEVQAQLGSSMGQTRRIDQITIHFYRTIGAKFGKVSGQGENVTPIDDMEEVNFEQTKTDQFGTTFADFYTGDKRLVFNPGYETRPKIKIQSDLPLPMQVTHVVARMVVYE